jgi:hypothetical protein
LTFNFLPEPHIKISREFGTNTTTICKWKSNKTQILEKIEEFQKDISITKRKKMKNAEHKDLDDCLIKWFKNRRSLGDPVTGPTICHKALELNAKLNGDQSFKASQGWLEIFKKSYAISEYVAKGENYQPTILLLKNIKK